MNERLVEDWLSKANERSYQTPFAQALLAEGMQVLRVGHSSHEHGKDIIAVDGEGKVHAYQLKDGDFDLKDFEKEFGQITALVETQVEHPGITGHPKHQPWLVISGQVSMPVEDRIRVYNLAWRKRRYTPLKIVTGRQLLAKFNKMAANFWPQMPEDSNRLFNLYLADGKGTLDREAFWKLLVSIVTLNKEMAKAEVLRRLSVTNLFASYSLSPFYATENTWELVQGWTMVAAQIAWSAEKAEIAEKDWRPVYRLAVEEALSALGSLANEALLPKALGPRGFAELDELTRTRCTICAGAIAAKVLVARYQANKWEKESLAKQTIEELWLKNRMFLWGESAVPFFLAMMWALDNLRSDHFGDNILFSTLAGITKQNSRFGLPKLPPPYDSGDEANAKFLRRLFKGEEALDMQASSSYSLEALVTIVARRLWRNTLAAFWPEITKVDSVRLVPDEPCDMLLWNWGEQCGRNQLRKFGAPQSWSELLIESRLDESEMLPSIIRKDLDFAILFLLCFPHRLNRPFVKFMEGATRNLTG